MKSSFTEPVSSWSVRPASLSAGPKNFFSFNKVLTIMAGGLLADYDQIDERKHDLKAITNSSIFLHLYPVLVPEGVATPETLRDIESANGTYLKATVGNTPSALQSDGTETVSLRSLMSRFGDTNIEILKVDIEGAEREILIEMTEVPICQILIELHFGTPLESLEFIRRLSQSNFYLFRQEVNPAGMHMSEYSFIHKNCLEKYGVTTIYGRYIS
ncbi:methyltransferase domain-containing protein [Ditylenchus destructor]|nr:methyltransferase domain-containing protein [Ditylenchus destructor]